MIVHNFLNGDQSQLYAFIIRPGGHGDERILSLVLLDSKTNQASEVIRFPYNIQSLEQIGREILQGVKLARKVDAIPVESDRVVIVPL